MRRSSFEELLLFALSAERLDEEPRTPAPGPGREEESTERTLSRKKSREELDDIEIPDDLQEFVDCFKKSGSDKVPKPIKRLVEWYLENRDKMWICRSGDGHLELTYDRPQLIRHFTEKMDCASHVDIARKTVQNFERCLNSVKPKLIVLESTHGKDLKRIGFAAPETIFGTERSSLSQKVERQLSRRAKKVKSEGDF